MASARKYACTAGERWATRIITYYDTIGEVVHEETTTVPLFD